MWVAAVSAYALRGRALAEDLLAVSLLLIAFLMAVSLVAAATSALWQVPPLPSPALRQLPVTASVTMQ